MLVTVDMLIDGTHFHLAETDPKRIGRKAMAVNLSDIAAMAGIPRYAVVSVALPGDGGRALAETLHEGMTEMAAAFDTVIVGGDTNSGSMPLTISVTLIGEATEHGVVKRNGAKPGDWLLATGAFGGSLAGRHLDFTPRIREALILNERADLHAMIDVSDGLGADVWHICEESDCGATLFADAIPLSDAASSLDNAPHDGEDFELVFAASEVDGRRLIESQPLGETALSHIGEVISERELYLQREAKRQVVRRNGFVHRLD